MPCIDAVVTYLFEMFFGDMLDEPANEIKGWDGLHDQFVIPMTVIVKGDHVTIIFVNAGSGDDRAAKIAPNVFGNNFWVTLIRFGMDIETVFVVPIDGGFHLFEVRSDLVLKFIEQSGLESIPQKMVVEMGLGAPMPTIADTALRDEAVDMGVPFQVTSEGMEDTDKAGSKAFGFVVFVEHT